MNLLRMRLKSLLGQIKVQEILIRHFKHVDVLAPIIQALSTLQEMAYAQNAIPVVSGKRLAGFIRLSDMAQLSPEELYKTKTSDIMHQLACHDALSPHDSVAQALDRMLCCQTDMLPVVEHDSVIGIVTGTMILALMSNTNGLSQANAPKSLQQKLHCHEEPMAVEYVLPQVKVVR